MGVPFLMTGQQEALLESTRQHLVDLGDLQSYQASWRKEVFIEYYYCNWNVKCTCDSKGHYPSADSNCGNLADNSDCWCGKPSPTTDPNCFETEDLTNNFIALRELGEGNNMVYAEFQTGDMTNSNIQFDNISFVEYYDLSKDPWEMHNLAKTTPAAKLAALRTRLRQWFQCAGASCP